MGVINNNVFGLIKGEKGEKGEGLKIVKYYDSVEEMNADFSNPEIAVGDTVAIKDTLAMYVKGSSAFESVGTLKGEAGADGADGQDGANGQDGADGATPEIGENGNWWINGADTGKPSRGADGQDGITPLVPITQLSYSENEYNINFAFIPLKANFNRTPIQDEIFNAVLNVTDVNGDYLYAAQAVVQVYNANYDLDHVECRVISKYRISGQDGANGQDGLSALTTLKSHSGNMFPNGDVFIPNYLCNRDIVEGDQVLLPYKNTETGKSYLCSCEFAQFDQQYDSVKGETVQGASFSIQNFVETTGAAGADGADGATPEIGENGNWWINGEDTGKPSRGADGAAGADGYISSKKAKIQSYKWIPTTWNGFTDFYGTYIWTDGENIYYSARADQYVLDRATSTWTEKTWNGLTNFYGQDVWTDGENIYYSIGANQYVLDRATSTWRVKIWNGLTNMSGRQLWTDGENIYHSNEAVQYVLDRATSTWTKKTWNGLTNFSGELGLWTDGENIYHSNAGQYVLDRATSTWRVKIWNGLTNLMGAYVWTDGENIYYSAGADQYVLDRATSTWTEKTWNGFTNFYAGVIWTDGENIYLSSGATKQYVLSPVIASSKPFIKR